LNYNNKGVATKRSNAQLNLKHFYLAFLILIIGYLLALLQFCREKVNRGTAAHFGDVITYYYETPRVLPLKKNKKLNKLLIS
jgi:hypothetical protein